MNEVSDEGRSTNPVSRATLLALAAVATALPTASGAVDTTELAGASHLNWNGRLEQRTLDDSSRLNEYTALTSAVDTAAVSLRIGFLPRFECTPVMGVRFGGAMASVPEAFFEDGDVLAVTIDGESVEWPLLVDDGDSGTTLWLDAELSRRADIRQRMDVGSRARLALPNTISIEFSLLGSRRSTAEVESACLSHEPLPWGD